MRQLSGERLQRRRAVAGGPLSLDAFERFGEARDSDAGLRLLRLLAARVPDQQARASRCRTCWRRRVDARPTPLPERRQPPAETDVGGRPVAVPDGRPREARRRLQATALSRSRARPSEDHAHHDIRRTPLPDGVRITIEMDARGARFTRSALRDRRGFRRSAVERAPASALVDRTLRFERRRPRPPGPDRTSSESTDPGRARRGRCLELQRLPAVQPVSAGHRLRARRRPGGDGRLVRLTAIAAPPAPAAEAADRRATSGRGQAAARRPRPALRLEPDAAVAVAGRVGRARRGP